LLRRTIPSDRESKVEIWTFKILGCGQ